MFILNKKGTDRVYRNVLPGDCSIRIVDDKWQLIYNNKVDQLDIETLFKYKLGSIPYKDI